MRNQTGQFVSGTDFYGRIDELRELWEHAERGNVVLLAPRRVGKTSILNKMLDEPREGWQTAYLDVMSVDSEQRFVARLLAKLYSLAPKRELWRALGDGLLDRVERLTMVRAGPLEWELVESIGDDWKELGQLALSTKFDRPTLLMIDELPIFVQRLLRAKGGPERTDVFMHWFRSARAQLTGDDGGLRFILAGSIGLDSVVSRVGLSATIADLHPCRLGPFDRPDAEGLLETLGLMEAIDMTDAVVARILERVSWWIPYHLQLVFKELWCLDRFEGRTVCPALVDEAYESLLELRHHKDFAHWIERLDKQAWAPAERDLMNAVLAAAAKDPAGVSTDVVRQLAVDGGLDPAAVLPSLEHDGYLVFDHDRYRFGSALLREWWARWGPGGVRGRR